MTPPPSPQSNKQEKSGPSRQKRGSPGRRQRGGDGVGSRGVEDSGGTDGETSLRPRLRSLAWGGHHPPRGKHGTPSIHPRTCAPVVAGSLWRLPAPQRRGAPGWGNCRQRCMAASLAKACCAISNLVRHALWIGGAPLHGNLGFVMAGGSQQDLEL